MKLLEDLGCQLSVGSFRFVLFEQTAKIGLFLNIGSQQVSTLGLHFSFHKINHFGKEREMEQALSNAKKLKRDAHLALKLAESIEINNDLDRFESDPARELGFTLYFVPRWVEFKQRSNLRHSIDAEVCFYASANLHREPGEGDIFESIVHCLDNQGVEVRISDTTKDVILESLGVWGRFGELFDEVTRRVSGTIVSG